jgi:hypothetical protein
VYMRLIESIVSLEGLPVLELFLSGLIISKILSSKSGRTIITKARL